MMETGDSETLLLGAIILGTLLAIGLWSGPRLLARVRHWRSLGRRALYQDALKHVLASKHQGQQATSDSLAGALGIAKREAVALIASLEAARLIQSISGALVPTVEGERRALRVLRAHRLWERHLADETGFDEAEWHDQAERKEHRMSPAEANLLSRRLGHPTHDPHGDPIPTASGELVSHGGRALTAMAIDEPMRIVHLEDEPEAVYAQLVAEGLHPDMEVRLTEISPHRVRFWAAGDEHVLAPIVAANISVVPVLEEQKDELIPGVPLASLHPGQRGKVLSISPACRGPERRRLMDLGILPGTVIEAEMTSPGRDPTAYRIRDALIALRREEANLININPQEEIVG